MPNYTNWLPQWWEQKQESKAEAEPEASQGAGAAATAREYTKIACVLLQFVFSL